MRLAKMLGRRLSALSVRRWAFLSSVGAVGRGRLVLSSLWSEVVVAADWGDRDLFALVLAMTLVWRAIVEIRI